MRHLSAIVLVVMLIAGAVQAAQKYASSAATGGGNGSSGSPWTIGQAGQLASPGDTVNLVFSGTPFTQPLVPAVSGTENARIVYRGYGGRTKLEINALSFTHGCYNSQDYISLENLEILMTNVTQVSPREARNILYVAPGADYMQVRRCWIHTDADLFEMHATESFVHGVFQYNARWLIVDSCKIQRTRFHYFATGNALPRYTTWRGDTLQYAWMSAVDFQSPTGPTYIDQQILMERCWFDSVTQEDGIQWEHDYTEGAYNGLLTPQHSGYVIRHCVFSRIAENAIDTKGGLSRIIIEHNTIHNVVGDDNGPWLGGDGGGRILGHNSIDQYSIQAALQYHQVSSTGWMIERFNSVYDVGACSGMGVGLMSYNNTYRNIRRRWTGPNAPDDSLKQRILPYVGGQAAFMTANAEQGKVSWNYRRATLFRNNIVTEAPGGGVYLAHSSDTLDIDYNLYHKASGTLYNLHRNAPYTWPTFTFTEATTLSAWQTELGKSWYANTTGEEAHSLWGVDPQFVNFPSNAWGQIYSPEIGSGSPARNAAGPLATVTASVNYNTYIMVSTPYPFFAGYPAIGVKGDSVIWGDGSQGPREVTGIVGRTLQLSGGPVSSEVGDQVRLWRGGKAVTDMGAWQYGWQTGGGSPPPPPPPIDRDTVDVSWSKLLHPITLVKDAHFRMSNIRSRDIYVVVSNSGHTLTWDDKITWLTEAPPLVPGALSWYTISRAGGDMLVGAMTGPISGELAPAEWSKLLGSPTQSAPLMAILNTKAETDQLLRYDSATVQLMSAGTTWLAPSNTDSTTPPVYFSKPFQVDSILIWYTGGPSDLCRFDVRFGTNASLGGGGTSLGNDGVWVDNASTWFKSAPVFSTIPAFNSAWVYVRNKTGSPKRASVMIKGRWLAGTAYTPPPSYSDEFNGSALESKWLEHDPQGDVALSVGSGVLTVSIPGGVDHDLYTAIDHALRLRQTYTGSADFTLEVKVTSTMTSNIQFFGLIGETDDDDLVRFVMVHANSDHNVSGATLTSGTYAETFWTNIGDPTQPYYLRMVKSGTNYACYHSLTGTDWTSDGTVSWSGTVNRIGIVVGTASGASSPAFSCTVDYFHYTGN